MASSTDSSVLIRHFSNNLFTPKLNKAKISCNDVVTQRSQLTDSARTALLVRTQGSTPPQSLWPHYVSINQMAEEKWATKPCYKSERKLQVVGQGLSHNNLIQILNWFSWTHPDTFFPVLANLFMPNKCISIPDSTPAEVTDSFIQRFWCKNSLKILTFQLEREQC